MARFFINRPIVAMVISIIMVILGVIAMVQLPIAQFPDIAPPEILLQATYVGADAVTLEKSVATPIEQMMSGVDNMIYMYSVNANNGQMSLRVDFDINTRPNDDQILTQMRYSQAESQLPSDVRNLGVTIKKSTTSPLALFSLYSPNGTYDATFLANYAYININDPMTRVPGIGQVQIFGAGQYAMRFWVRPDQLAKLGITVPEILNAIKAQNTVNPAGQIGAEPAPYRTGVHLHRSRARPVGDGRRIREYRDPREPGRVYGAVEGRGSHRAGRADVQHDRPDERKTRRSHRHLSAAGI